MSWANISNLAELDAAYGTLRTRLASLISESHLDKNAAGDILPFETETEQSLASKPIEGKWVEFNGQSFHLLYTERGETRVLLENANAEAVLFMLIEKLTFSFASNFECRNRKQNQDFRRGLFEEQERLISLVYLPWLERLQRKHTEIISRHPFQDPS